MTETKIHIWNRIADTLLGDLNGPVSVTAILYISVVFVVMLDLWAGLRRARKLGHYRSSYGLRKTVQKMGSYFNMILVLTVIDGMQIFSIYHLNEQLSFSLPLFPILTFVGAVFVGVIEFKSIYEKANDKDKGRYQETARLINEIMKMADSRELHRVAAYFKSDKNKGGEGLGDKGSSGSEGVSQ